MGTAGPLASVAGGRPQSGSCSRIESIVDRIRAIIRSGGVRSDSAVLFFNLCISLSRGIDYALSCNEVPEKANELPSLIKQVYHYNHDILLQSAFMLLMISVKNACGLGWFCDKDARELCALANEVSNNFSSTGNVMLEPKCAVDIISKIIPRFYPWLKLGRIIVSLEAKVGYGALVADFYVPKSIPSYANERIRLFIAQTESIETSSCIISPPEVNFVINGKGVEKRNSASMDSGPQFPTDVTSMLVFGTNLIQAIGNFNGNYIIAIAYMSMTVPKSDAARIELPDYVQRASAATALPSDGEVIEGPSRISLNCPISFKRIKTPVKGQLCRHHQCFDYSNFLEINLRKPSWRCPHCNQPVSCCDLRIDQNMAMILQEVREHIVDVLISGDGSWKIVSEKGDSNGHIDCQQKPNESSSTSGQQEEGLGEGSRSSNTHIVDLTLEAVDGEVSIVEHQILEFEDIKPFHGLQGGFENLSENPVVDVSEAAAQAVHAPDSQIGAYDVMWTRILSLVTSVSTENTDCGSSGTGAAVTIDSRTNCHSSAFPVPTVPAPILTDAVSPALNREIPQTVSSSFQKPADIWQLVASTENLPLQQQPQRNENPLLSGSSSALRSSIPRHINRTPIAVQALPAQTQLPTPFQPQPAHHQRLSRSTVHPISPSGGILSRAIISQAPTSLPTSADTGFCTAVSVDMERLQSFSRQPVQSAPASDVVLPAFAMTQDHQYAVPPSQSFQQIVGLPAASQVASSSLRMIPSEQQQHRASGAYRVASGSALLDHQNMQLPPAARVSSQIMNRSVASSLSKPYSPRFPNTPTNNCFIGGHQQHNSRTSSQMTRQLSGSQRSSSSFPVSSDSIKQQVPMGERPQRHNLSLGAAEGLQLGNTATPELLAEQSWRPTGRMMGNLSGRAHSTALGHLMVQPTASATLNTPRQMIQPAMQLPQTTPAPSQGHGLVTNKNIQAHTS
ncbi:E4 SUMO-protein ligase PIAL2 isoform X2 [Aristolochia californica]|uniref:E4 SUMO-protein ligase PIAL2 isoform X2 n=1 Tax=Aristolochia californica TaxID=171875 RepID=UPI0035E0C8F6